MSGIRSVKAKEVAAVRDPNEIPTKNTPHEYAAKPKTRNTCMPNTNLTEYQT